MSANIQSNEEIVIKALQLLTVSAKLPMYKTAKEDSEDGTVNVGDTITAENMELIQFEENAFEVVGAKGLYEIGDTVVYIQPDYCLSDIPLFDSFIRPYGEERKSRLGKGYRIRAIKFNWYKENSANPVYSNGILMPLSEVITYLNSTDTNMFNKSRANNLAENIDWAIEMLGITKYVEPVKGSGGGIKGGVSNPFPTGLYKTGENNIMNVLKRMSFPIKLIGGLKVDGSSITIGIKENDPFICSRNQRKPLRYDKIVGQRQPNIIEAISQLINKYILSNVKALLKNINVNFNWEIPVNLSIIEKVDSDSDFVIYGKPYLDTLIKSNANNFVLRGELNGGHMKGSGNKNNPSKNEKPNIKFFGGDVISNGVATKLSHEDFMALINGLNSDNEDVKFQTVPFLFSKEFKSAEELIQTCEDYFSNNLVEGIVVRTPDSKFSAKVMNNVYDSKK